MISTIQALILLLAVVAAVAVVANRLEIPPAILLVLTGVLLALVPGLPPVELAPELVLLLVLPPVLYTSAFSMSWREFQFNLRPITLLSVGSVVFTTLAVAAAAHWLMDIDWAVGFVLGAIVSPPDAIAPLAIARRLELPRRILVVLEGEGLANDATALILYRFAVAAVSLGVFSFGKAAVTFAAIVAGELLWGIGVGWLMLRLRRWVDDTLTEILLSLLTPFLAFWVPVHLGGSGVLATVAAGLYVSWNGPRLISPATRLQGVFFWNFAIYVIEGMVFLITGLQARTVIGRIGNYPVSELALSVAVITAAVIVARFNLDVSCHLPAAAVVPCNQTKGSFAAVAISICAGIHGRARDRIPRGSPRYSAYNRNRTAISISRLDSVYDVFGDPDHPRRARSPVAVGDPKARSLPCRT
jgi:monovalent cation/hydrogen antiporter